MPKLRKKKRSGVPHLTWRGNMAYWSRRHEKLASGRIVKSLEVRRDREDLAVLYASALNTLCERGDWNVLHRWVEGDVHITEAARAVREGDYASLRRLNAEGSRLGPVVDRFMRRARATLADASVQNYESALKQLVDAIGEDYPLVSMTTEAAEAFLHAPKPRRGGKVAVWSARTQSSLRTTYKALWGMVIEQEAEAAELQGADPGVTRNPWIKARVPKGRKTRHSFLTHEQWASLIAHPSVYRTPQAAFLCAGILGLRRAEIQYLRPGKDVLLDRERPILKIQDRQGAHAWKTKTENSVREVLIPKKLLHHFEYHAAHFSGEHFFFVAENRDTPVSNGTASNWTQACFEAAGLRYGREGDALTLHSLRHTCATWQLSAGVPLPTVAKWLGDTKEMILSTYGHAIKDDDSRAISAMEENL